jgi:molybdopterin converting factor small subunit
MIVVEVRFFGEMTRFTRKMSPAVERDLPRVTLPDGATVNDLLQILAIPTEAGRPLVTVNRFYQRDNVLLADGDRVELLRTVVGGSR